MVPDRKKEAQRVKAISITRPFKSHYSGNLIKYRAVYFVTRRINRITGQPSVRRQISLQGVVLLKKFILRWLDHGEIMV